MDTTSNIPGVGGADRGQPKSNNRIDAVFTNKKDNSTLDQSDFMKLMVAQMQNQDFMNPMDDTQMVDQMVAFSNMQQMQEMASNSKSQYAMSLLGKNVTASRFTVSGNLDTTTGPVQTISLVDNEYVLVIGGKKYEMGEIMSVGNGTDSTINSVSPDSFPLIADSADIKPTTAVVKWRAPTEDAMTAKGLKYTVYASKRYVEEPPETEKPGTPPAGEKTDPEVPPVTDPEKPKPPVFKDVKFDTLEAVEAGTLMGEKNQVGSPDKDGTFNQVIVGLEPDTEYYINIVVTDANGKKCVYKPVTIKTRKAMD